MSTRIDTAMLLAAGFGKRMRPLTDTVPKPLVPLAGRPLIDWARDRMEKAGINRFVVNTHYLADRLDAHFADDPAVTLSREPDILETGGGVAKALPLLGEKPFVVANADAVWLDGPTPSVQRLIDAWDGRKMDALLLFQPTVAANDYGGAGDYFLDPNGLASRRREGEVAPYLFAGVQILSPKLFEGAPDGAFSLNTLYDKAEEKGRLRAIVHDGEWYHVGTPRALSEVEETISLGHTKSNTR